MATIVRQEREPTLFNSRLICFFVATALFIALLYRQNDLSLLAMLVLLIMGGSKIWSGLSLSRVSCTSYADKKKIFPGETLTMAATVSNAKFLPVWVRLDWSSNHAFDPLYEESAPLRGTSLLWHQQARYDRNLVALRRGCYRMGPSHIQASDLFGFFRSGKKLEDAVEVVVYPKRIALKPVLLPRHDLFGTPGDRSPVKDPVYILGTRDYQPSRPSRYIHWKASARHLRLQEKMFEPSQQGKFLIALDVGAFEKSRLADGFEHTLEVIASLALRLAGMGFAVGLLANGTAHGGDFSVIPAGRSPQQLSAILEALARLKMEKKARLSHIMQQIPGTLRGSSCALFCCEKNADTDNMLIFCRKRNISPTLFTWRFDRHGAGKPRREDVEVQPIESLVAPPDAPS